MRDKAWTMLRLMLYGLVVVAIVFRVQSKINVHCFFAVNYGVICPMCGATRATLSILNADFLTAIKYNAFYTLVIFPFSCILIIEDIFVVIQRTVFKKTKNSLIEIMFGGIK